jgi:cyclophilin family peptidyl-prolyl cis-trans isomerase
MSEGPIFDPGLIEDQPGAGAAGYYDGLVFDLAFPRSSLATSVRPPADSILFATEIDADALGLDRQFIETTAEANRVWQFVLFPHLAGLSSDDELHPELREFRTRWGEERNADFLVGVSRKEINEALGYGYREGLDSQKNARGAVALEAFDATRSTPRLVIVLSDAPHFDGRRMVVGRIVSGLELADAISGRPLIPAKAVKNRPMVPVAIAAAGVECRLPAATKNGAKGAE